MQRVNPVNHPRKTEEIAPDNGEIIDPQCRELNGAKEQPPAKMGAGAQAMNMENQKPCEDRRRNDKSFARMTNRQQRTNKPRKDNPKAGINFSEEWELLNHDALPLL